MLLLSQKRRCTTNDSASSVRLPSRGGSPLRPAPLTPAYPFPKGLPVQLGFFFGAPTPKKPRGPQWGAPRPVQAVTLSICPVMPCSEGRGSIVLRVAWAVAHPLRVLAPRHAAIRSRRVRRPLSLRARGRASRRWQGLRRWCARWWLRAISSAACCPAVRAVRRRRAVSLLRTVVGGGLPVFV